MRYAAEDVEEDFRGKGEEAAVESHGLIVVVLEELNGISISVFEKSGDGLHTSSGRTNLFEIFRPKSSLRAWHFSVLGFAASFVGGRQLQPTPGMSDMGRKVLISSLLLWKLREAFCTLCAKLNRAFCCSDEAEARFMVMMYSPACPDAIRDDGGEIFRRR